MSNSRYCYGAGDAKCQNDLNGFHWVFLSKVKWNVNAACSGHVPRTNQRKCPRLGDPEGIPRRCVITEKGVITVCWGVIAAKVHGIGLTHTETIE